MKSEKTTSSYFAAIDIGSNAIRLIVGEVKNEQLCVIASRREFLRLGDDVFRHDKISSSSLEQLCQILNSFQSSLDGYPGVKTTVTATSAMRDACNQKTVVEQVQKQLDMTIRVLSGNEEAKLVQGILRHCASWQEGSAVLADLGGGSLEISVMQGAVQHFRESFNCGALRFAKMTVNEQDAKRENLRQSLLNVLKPGLSPLILSGGNAKVLARLSHQQFCADTSISSIVKLSWPQFLTAQAHFLEKGPKWYVEQGIISAQQAEVFLPALTLFELVGNLCERPTLILPFVGFKEGVLWSWAQEHFPDNPLTFCMPSP